MQRKRDGHHTIPQAKPVSVMKSAMIVTLGLLGLLVLSSAVEDFLYAATDSLDHPHLVRRRSVRKPGISGTQRSRGTPRNTRRHW